MAKHPGGRPFKYKTATALQEGIEKYFADCQGEVLRNSDGDPVLDKHGPASGGGSKAPHRHRAGPCFRLRQPPSTPQLPGKAPVQ